METLAVHGSAATATPEPSTPWPAAWVSINRTPSEPPSIRGRDPRAQPGWTLVELLVVIAIAVVLMASALPTLGVALRYQAVSSASRAVSGALFVAKTRAAMQLTHARVRVLPGSRWFATEVFDRTSAQWTTLGGPTVLGSGVSFGFGPATVPPPGRTHLAQQQPPAGQLGPVRPRRPDRPPAGAAQRPNPCFLVG